MSGVVVGKGFGLIKHINVYIVVSGIAWSALKNILGKLLSSTVRSTQSKAHIRDNQPPLAARSRANMVNYSVLDPCCGSKMMWFDKNNPNVVFGDIRSEIVTVMDRSHGRTDGKRVIRIEPDTLLDFRDLPFQDCFFRLVAFDPPHLQRAGSKSWMAAKYGKLSDNWRDDLRRGFAECFRVLEPGGVLVFKWSETQVKVGDVLKLAPQRPLFGQVSGRSGMTHWLIFMKGSL